MAKKMFLFVQRGVQVRGNATKEMIFFFFFLWSDESSRYIQINQCEVNSKLFDLCNLFFFLFLTIKQKKSLKETKLRRQPNESTGHIQREPFGLYKKGLQQKLTNIPVCKK